MNIRFVGDTHEPERWAELRSGAKTSIHVGDVAIGRGNEPKQEAAHRFIRGNKDDARLAHQRKDFMGNYGFDAKLHLYFISGAASVDKPMPFEQLSNGAFSAVFYQVKSLKPVVIVSHDCPFSLGLADWQGKTVTNQWLDKIFREYQPALWVFGHHHVDFDKAVNGTRFVGIGKYHSREIDI